jgi:quinol-cytochrome oxidoreductase complex cytochrome b subunit
MARHRVRIAPGKGMVWDEAALLAMDAPLRAITTGSPHPEVGGQMQPWLWGGKSVVRCCSFNPRVFHCLVSFPSGNIL